VSLPGPLCTLRRCGFPGKVCGLDKPPLWFPRAASHCRLGAWPQDTRNRRSESLALQCQLLPHPSCHRAKLVDRRFEMAKVLAPCYAPDRVLGQFRRWRRGA
jgi:hypothetical protein